ncbi:MlaE family lipid ABC transporter permease subunit [Thiolapillus sp.]
MTDNTDKAGIELLPEGEGLLIRGRGSWRAETLGELPRELDRRLDNISRCPLQWDMSLVSSMDSAGMLLFLRALDHLGARDCDVRVTGLSEAQERLREMVVTHLVPVSGEKPALGFRVLQPLVQLGKGTVSAWRDLLSFLSFLGEDFIVLLLLLVQPWRMRWAAVVKHVQEAGVRALPIITLTSFLIGVVIAYQGAVQLQKFGANIFVVDMIGITVTRELAPLITAIVVAGRTGSSYTAQIGVMKITQEIDAMRTMGFEPHRFLVLPRVIAVMIALPLMIFFADVIGILGGMVVAKVHLNISWSEFIHRLQNVLDVKHLWIGIAKGPFFAWLIAIVGCFRGFQVSRNTESIGRYTTISVVNAIFLVIACDALFSVIFTRLGI